MARRFSFRSSVWGCFCVFFRFCPWFRLWFRRSGPPPPRACGCVAFPVLGFGLGPRVCPPAGRCRFAFCCVAWRRRFRRWAVVPGVRRLGLFRFAVWVRRLPGVPRLCLILAWGCAVSAFAVCPRSLCWSAWLCGGLRAVVFRSSRRSFSRFALVAFFSSPSAAGRFAARWAVRLGVSVPVRRSSCGLWSVAVPVAWRSSRVPVFCGSRVSCAGGLRAFSAALWVAGFGPASLGGVSRA